MTVVAPVRLAEPGRSDHRIREFRTPTRNLLDARGRSVVRYEPAALIARRGTHTNDLPDTGPHQRQVIRPDRKAHPMTMTTLHLGQVPGRARLASACARSGHRPAAWRSALAMPAFGGFRATTVALNTIGNGYVGIADPAGDVGRSTVPTTKRPTRHLAVRST